MVGAKHHRKIDFLEDIATVIYGGGGMICGYFSGVLILHIIKGNMKAVMYLEILEKNSIFSSKQMDGSTTEGPS